MLAACAYSSQCEPAEEIVLRPVTLWRRGDRSIGGVIPLLILEDGRSLYESGTICEYIDETWPEPPLRPAASASRRRGPASAALWSW